MSSRPRKILIAVNREIRTMPEAAQTSALAELARHLAREVDVGDGPAAMRLTRVLKELHRLAKPPVSAGQGVAESAPEVDWVDDLAARRADRLANAAGGERAGVGDERRRGGRRAR